MLSARYLVGVHPAHLRPAAAPLHAAPATAAVLALVVEDPAATLVGRASLDAMWVRSREEFYRGARLPTSLAGQLIVSKTLAGLLYVFVADGRVPFIFEVAGILLVVSGVLIGIRRTSSLEAEEAPPAADEV